MGNWDLVIYLRGGGGGIVGEERLVRGGAGGGGVGRGAWGFDAKGRGGKGGSWESLLVRNVGWEDH